jgi:hypothetical protein
MLVMLHLRVLLIDGPRSGVLPVLPGVAVVLHGQFVISRAITLCSRYMYDSSQPGGECLHPTT